MSSVSSHTGRHLIHTKCLLHCVETNAYIIAISYSGKYIPDSRLFDTPLEGSILFHKLFLFAPMGAESSIQGGYEKVRKTELIPKKLCYVPRGVYITPFQAHIPV